MVIARKRIVDGVTEANLGGHRLAEPCRNAGFQPGKNGRRGVQWQT